MTKPIRHEPHFFGATTLGEKGQVVIPAEARAALNLKKGDKLLVIGMGPGQLALSTLTGLERLVSHLTTRLDAMRDLTLAKGKPAQSSKVKTQKSKREIRS